jgi:hypothetical protein
VPTGALRAVIINGRDWSGLTCPIPAGLLVDRLPPRVLTALVREIRVARHVAAAPGTALEQRVWPVRCRYVTRIGPSVFYAPAPGQGLTGEAWDDAARSIVGLGTATT